jgi:hypothetical protein
MLEKDCAWFGIARAWLDQNGNAVWDEGETPLSNVTMHIDDVLNSIRKVGGRTASDATGEAPLSVWLPGCPAVEGFEVYPEVPRGYRLTTDGRVRVAGTGTVTQFGSAALPVVLSGIDLRGAKLFGSDLSKTDFSGTNLTNADLREANLSNSDLNRADLTSANLHEADLSGSDLRGADLTNADLREANLINSDLTGADLSSTDLRAANLFGAHLSEVDLTGANLAGANLRQVDLYEAKYDHNTKWPTGFDPFAARAVLEE